MSPHNEFPGAGSCEVLHGRPKGGSRNPFLALIRSCAQDTDANVFHSLLARIKYDRMDALDKWSVLFITAIIIYAAALLVLPNGQSQAGEDGNRRAPVRQTVVNPELDNKIQLARDLLVRDNLEKTELLVDSLIGEFPYEGQLYMLKGDILMRRQQPVAAMYEYKEAVELNPDFLDKKTELFQGKKIKVTVEEAMAAIESRLSLAQDDIQLKDHLNTVYYMKRKLAGGCG